MLRPSRVGVLHLALLGSALALVARAAYVQLWQGGQWAALGAREHAAAPPALALRGAIVDADHQPLVITRDLVQLGVAPREIRDQAALARALARAKVHSMWIQRATDPHRQWVVLPGRLFPADAAAATALHGVYATPVAERVTVGPPGTSAIVGHVGPDGAGLDGIEAALDSVLRGDPARALVLRDALGRALESPTGPPQIAPTGDTVVLSFNRTLQEICERALDDAVSQMAASGGDIVVLDPNDGSVLALASRRPGSAAAATTLTEPFEPGSTIKPIVAAALLARDRVAPSDVVYSHGGRWQFNGRTITDTHPVNGPLTLRDVIRWSSNVGIAQFVQRLTPREEFEALRDAGFGSPTGVPFAAEASGTLRPPVHWSKQSAASLAIGYEVAVTPLQLALAYAAIANGGVLLEPALVREIRGSGGVVRYRAQRRVVRRLMPPSVAAQLREMLIATVAEGTASEAGLPTFIMAGKTGTARRTQYGAGYERNQYTASFVGLFPGRDPQYVILVKLDNPTSSYYGGKTAAPVSKAVLEAAIAAPDALDRGKLAASRPVALANTTAAPPPDSVDGDPALRADSGRPEHSEEVPIGTQRPDPAPRPASLVVVPDIRGLTLRAATRALHRVGLRVDVVDGPTGTTEPRAGFPVRSGTVVRIGGGA